jgi:hypothetical protein
VCGDPPPGTVGLAREWDCAPCPPYTQLADGCFIPDPGTPCPDGFDYSPSYGGECCPQQTSGTCVEVLGSQAAYDEKVRDCMKLDGGAYWMPYPECRCSDPSPVLVDVGGDGFSLTSRAGGVTFDINGDGTPDRLPWTAAGSDDAWLALDRDGDGSIDDGRELFGNFTPQPPPPAGRERNGFLALAVFDAPARGGNADGVIDDRDPVFPRLRLWQDENHDGVSQAGELHALPALGVARLHLDYKESKRTDAHGNQFRYRAKVDDEKGEKVNRWAWDVFLVGER